MNIRKSKIKRKNRARYKLKSVADINNRFRLYFYLSNNYLYTQVINDNQDVTVTSYSTYNKEFKDYKRKNNIEVAKKFGESVAKSLLDKDIKNIYFDRGERKYHGRVKAFAESARNSGLNF